MYADKYWEYDRKPFKERNWVDFAEKLNVEFPQEPQRTWQQCRDKWLRMRHKYLEEKEKQGQTGAAPTRWPWYEIFDNMLGGTAKI
ncbi:hypothetical protein KC19_VG164300 [Ceratodon purpureus]|uniref:Myb/SANT-like DNA-binding domain-containing protein n=1 Tax=Ceratodon purpureus TaxID=3225 RepID=A0A8T0HR54_CERPU|nr:hypothetical protein KC19_VG164300 [Ceratodon purpureus]